MRGRTLCCTVVLGRTRRTRVKQPLAHEITACHSCPGGTPSIGIALDDHRGPRHVERMIDQDLHAFEEADRMWQFRVNVEGGFVPPARMDVEESRVACRSERVEFEAARFVTRRSGDLPQRLLDRILL